jgi:hypothetical protein
VLPRSSEHVVHVHGARGELAREADGELSLRARHDADVRRPAGDARIVNAAGVPPLVGSTASSTWYRFVPAALAARS